jgi:hypothetical protein
MLLETTAALKCEGKECLGCIEQLKFCKLKSCVWPTQALRGSGPAQALDINVLNALNSDIVEVSSSSCELSLFLSKVGSAHSAGEGVLWGGL